jgi:hypothetical protein
MKSNHRGSTSHEESSTSLREAVPVATSYDLFILSKRHSVSVQAPVLSSPEVSLFLHICPVSVNLPLNASQEQVPKVLC